MSSKRVHVTFTARFLKGCNYRTDGRFASERCTCSNETLLYNNMPKHDFQQTQIIYNFNPRLLHMPKMERKSKLLYTLLEHCTREFMRAELSKAYIQVILELESYHIYIYKEELQLLSHLFGRLLTDCHHLPSTAMPWCRLYNKVFVH